VSDETVILAGGPYHGRRVTVAPATTVVSYPAAPPRPPMEMTLQPKPSWLHPVRRARWKSSPPPVPPTFRMLSYQAAGNLADGTRVFWLARECDNTSPPPDRGRLYAFLNKTLVDVHPVDRASPHARWVMGLDWYKALRRMAGSEPEDEDQWVPAAGDQVLGYPVQVVGETGAPQFVTSPSGGAVPHDRPGFYNR
jgi:hypothetical protein